MESTSAYAPLWLLLTRVICGCASPVLPYRGCTSSCEYKGICFPVGQTWTDSTAGCVRFSCVSSTSNNGRQLLTTAALGCALQRPPQDGTPYVEIPGEQGATYPACCPQILIQVSPTQASSTSQDKTSQGNEPSENRSPRGGAAPMGNTSPESKSAKKESVNKSDATAIATATTSA